MYLEPRPDVLVSPVEEPVRRALHRKRRRQEVLERDAAAVSVEAVARLPPPPLPAQDAPFFMLHPRLEGVRCVGLWPEGGLRGWGVGGA